LIYFSWQHIQTIPPQPSTQWYYIISGIVIGFLIVITNSILRNQLRFNILSPIFQNLTGLMMSAPFPPPKSPEFVNGPKIPVQPFYLAHPESHPLNIIGAQDIPLNQQFPELYKKVNHVFWIFGKLDKWLPLGNVKVEPQYKPRIDRRIPNEFYVNDRILNTFIDPRLLQPSEQFKYWTLQKQELAWLAQYGYLNERLEPISNNPKHGQLVDLSDCTHVVDFTSYRRYKSKPGYYGYGGIAYFKLHQKNW
jgi:hypothetical protein